MKIPKDRCIMASNKFNCNTEKFVHSKIAFANYNII